MAKVLIAEQSHIVALGLISLVKNYQDVEIVKVVYKEDECCEVVAEFEPDIILLNTSFLNQETMMRLMSEKAADALVIHIFNTSLPIGSPSSQISIFDDKASLHSKIEDALQKMKVVDSNDNEELSPRERSILKEVALGLTNKEIAEKTYISTHTVISHRKNITRKLGIKTVSGLTVYAILNNIIQMDDIS